MSRHPAWPAAEPIGTPRLALEPLRVEHAAEMAAALADEDLHRYIGGTPATAAELRERYRRQVAGRSPDGRQGWLNWVVRHRASGLAVGTVQATLTREAGQLRAELAWVTATAHQRQGYATEAATAMAGWLRHRGAGQLIAHIHPDHHASHRVAERLGMAPTPVTLDGETRWSTPAFPRIRGVLAVLVCSTIVMVAYWTLWYSARGVVASNGRPAYQEFENAFPAADGWLTLCLVAAALTLAGRRPTALLWLLAGGGAGLYLFAEDTLYDLEHGIWWRSGAGGLVELAINAVTLAVSLGLLRWAWRHRAAIGSPGTGRRRQNGDHE